jgi:GntR family transcriptional regulator/MocR family aminotransferase
MEPIPVPLDSEGIDVDHGCRLAPKATLAIVTPSVQYPTGIRMSDARRLRLLQWAETAHSWIFEVDHASEFPFGEQSGLPMASMRGAKRVIYFDTFGKLLFPSLRVAFLIVPQEALALFRDAARDFDRPPGVPNQIILADFLTSGQFAKHLRRSRDAYAERREVMLTALRERCAAYLTIDPAQSGLHVCARLPRGTDDALLVEHLREAGLVAEALSPYYANPTEDRGLLLGFAAYRPDVLRASVDKLATTVDEFLTSRTRAAAG